MHPETDPSISCEVLEYFLRRLSSPTSRQHAILVSKVTQFLKSEINIILFVIKNYYSLNFFIIILTKYES